MQQPDVQVAESTTSPKIVRVSQLYPKSLILWFTKHYGNLLEKLTKMSLGYHFLPSLGYLFPRKDLVMVHFRAFYKGLFLRKTCKVFMLHGNERPPKCYILSKMDSSISGSFYLLAIIKQNRCNLVSLD